MRPNLLGHTNHYQCNIHCSCFPYPNANNLSVAKGKQSSKMRSFGVYITWTRVSGDWEMQLMQQKGVAVVGEQQQQMLATRSVAPTLVHRQGQ